MMTQNCSAASQKGKRQRIAISFVDMVEVNQGSFIGNTAHHAAMDMLIFNRRRTKRERVIDI